jgi:hypothetical protein
MAKEQHRDGKPPREAVESQPQQQQSNIDFLSQNASQLRIDLHKPHIWADKEQVSAKQIKKIVDYTRGVEKSLPVPANAEFTPDRDATVQLARSLQNNKLVLVLGAGVSMGFGLPDWPTLLQKLMITTIEQEPEVSTALSKLFSAVFAPSSVMAGRYLQKFYEDKEESFEAAVRRVLYESLDIEAASALMEEIVHLCVAPGRSPTLDSIITYNFDDLLEQRLDMLDVKPPYMAIYSDGMHAGNRLPIYHVHGYLPSEGEIDLKNRITLGESVYHKQYTDIYSWNNIVQINKFTDFDCLFIGTSLTDPNIRRLLDVAYRQRGQRDEFHYVFKKRVRREDVQSRLELILKNDLSMMHTKVSAELDLEKTVDYLIGISDRFEESDTASFGVKTIWVNEFDEIPEILSEIREKALRG